MLRDHLPDFVRHLEASRAPRTVDNYRRAVDAFLELHVGDSPTRANVEAFLARPRPDGAARARGTRQLELVALRVFFAWMTREHATSDPTAGVRLPRREKRDPVFPSVHETRRLFEIAAETSDSARNLAILALLFGAGLRVSELVRLDAEQVDLVTGTLNAVVGKGGTVLDQVMCPRVVTLLARWLEERERQDHSRTGPLFPAARPTTSRTGRLSVRSVQRLVRTLAVASGSPKALSPHSLRHGTATLSIALGTDLATTAALLRHTSSATTAQVYVHVLGERERRTAAAKLGSIIPPEVLEGEPTEDDAADSSTISGYPSANGGVPGAVDTLPS